MTPPNVSRKRPLRLAAALLCALASPGCGDLQFGHAIVGGERRDAGGSDLGVVLDATEASDAADVARAADARDDAADRAESAAFDGAGVCRADGDCTDPARPACDVATGRCLACTPASDRCPRGQYCNPMTFACADGCRGDDDCQLPRAGDAGAAAPRYCDVGRRVCVACRRDAECPSGLFCAGGSCAAACSATRPCGRGDGCCDGACVDLLSNEGHCGACGRLCALPHAAAVCSGGLCAPGACLDPFGDCDGAPANGCETDLRSTANCGACDRACPVRPNAASTCTSGACGFLCAAGFADCDGVAANGCEVELAVDVAHCGACGAACRLAGATAACRAGRCAVTACAPGFGDCDGVSANGCETDVRASTASCGACGRACAVRASSTPSCVDGACRATCAAGSADCDATPENGCEVDTRIDALNCGACGRGCRPPNATGRCDAGACAVGACAAGFADCDARADNGCEVDLSTSTRSCGACGRACGAGAVCLAGACAVECGALARCAGACSDPQTDAANCGRCGNACPAGRACVRGACALVCASPELLCAGACVQPATDARNCDRCANVCAARANASARCAGGACGFACNGAYADCNASPSDGCEVATGTDARNCGGCGRACAFGNAGATCAAGRCALGACASGFGNCDGDAANGCESALASDARNCGRCGNVCPGGGVCAAGVCSPVVVIDRPIVVNTVAAPVTAAMGGRAATLVDAGGVTIPAGSRVLLHQTQGPGATAGDYELNRVLTASGASLTLETPLRYGYLTSGASHAQVVVVAEYRDLFIGETGELTAPEWNGRTGGILALVVSGGLTVTGSITMNGRGFRGFSRGCATAPATNLCQYGHQGESWTGFGVQGAASNGGGGGGGGQGQDCGSGGGGAYASGAARGSPGDCDGEASGQCAPVCPNEPGASGLAYGGTSLANVVHLGSSGGEGGMDEDGGYPGAGGTGGGVIFVSVAGTLAVTGSVSANGVDGLNGNQFACGGGGCGMGGGGGGAGGAIRLVATRATLGTGLVTAAGGNGGQCTCRVSDLLRASTGGRGGAGRIGVQAGAITGTTTPALDPS